VTGKHPEVVRIHPADTVAVTLLPLQAGARVADLSVSSDVPKGHKVALADHRVGDLVIKYGHPIGRATAPIQRGEHVHTHNLVTALAGELAYRRGLPPAEPPAAVDLPTWQGYLRADGRAATRNEIWILPTVGCVGMTAEEIARNATERHRHRIDGVHAFAHPHGCSQLGDDLQGTRALLAGLCANPNAAGVLLLGLGCESNQLDRLLDAVPPGQRHKIRTLTSQAVGDEIAEAARLVDQLADLAAHERRTPLPFSALSIGLKCGGSDAFSGLTANPLLGRLADRHAAAGGTAILTEIPEIFGAEQALFDRAVDDATFEAAAALINRFKRYYLAQGLPVSENPSPGNLAGGITTLEEKSLGAVQKGGQAPLGHVASYGGQAHGAGLTLLEAPGNDAVSSTALAAAGATLLLFTTGRGTPLGFPVPTLKVASNEQLAQAKPHWIDFDASAALRDSSDRVDQAFAACIASVASGSLCAAERAGQRAISIWKRGVTL
jgi:altronate hydrolase